MTPTLDTPGATAVRRYIATAAAGSLAAAEASIDGADCEALYVAAGEYASALLDQFSLEGEAPLAELVDTLTDTTIENWGLDDATAELVRGFARLTAFDGEYDGVDTYTAAVATTPDEATSAALVHTATLAIIVADATGCDTDTALELITSGD